MIITFPERMQATHLCYALFRMDRHTKSKMRMSEIECFAAFRLCRECAAPDVITDHFKDRLTEYLEGKS
jgi:hypothetical protein